MFLKYRFFVYLKYKDYECNLMFCSPRDIGRVGYRDLLRQR